MKECCEDSDCDDPVAEVCEQRVFVFRGNPRFTLSWTGDGEYEPYDSVCTKMRRQTSDMQDTIICFVSSIFRHSTYLFRVHRRPRPSRQDPSRHLHPVVRTRRSRDRRPAGPGRHSGPGRPRPMGRKYFFPLDGSAPLGDYVFWVNSYEAFDPEDVRSVAVYTGDELQVGYSGVGNSHDGCNGIDCVSGFICTKP